MLRDPIGIKPFVYLKSNGSVIFASEVKAFLKIPGLSLSIRKQSLADVLTFMYVPHPHTMYNQINKVEPGVCYVFKSGKQIDSHKLFSYISEKESFKSEAEAIDVFKDKFSSSRSKSVYIRRASVTIFKRRPRIYSAIAYEAIYNGANIKDAYTISISKIRTTNLITKR